MVPAVSELVISYGRTATTGLKDYETTATRVVEYYYQSSPSPLHGAREKRSKASKPALHVIPVILDNRAQMMPVDRQ